MSQANPSPTSVSPHTIPGDVLAFRKHFPTLATKVHLASNSKAAISDVVIEANREYLESWRVGGAPWDLWVAKHEELRAAFADLIGAEVEEIAVCFSATQALAMIASCFDWKSRPAVVFDDYSFPSVTHLWHAQATRGAQIRRVHPDSNQEILPQAFDEVLDDQVRLVSVSHVCYKNGHRLDLPQVAQRAHEVGAYFMVDDYQSCGSRPVNVRQDGIDVLVTGTLKYLLGSAGVTLMYVRKEILGDLHPAFTGWFGQEDPGNFQVERHIEAGDARKFQTGTPAVPAVYDSLAGINLIRSYGLGPIGAWIDHLTATLMAALESEGFVVATPQDPAKRGPAVAIRCLDVERAVPELAKRDIIVTSRDGNLRTAWHYYNTPDDIDALMYALNELRSLMVAADRCSVGAFTKASPSMTP